MHRTSWINDAVFYQIYPLGLCGAPPANDFVSNQVNRLEHLEQWIPHISALGCNALYLGPVFESDFHGYDTADYFVVDRRLGTNQTFKRLSEKLHQNGIKLVLDTVFNHTGRNFFAFKDLQIKRENSRYKDWFCGVDFSRDNSYGDGFAYDGWYDAYNLVKLNLTNPEVKQYLFDVVAFWMTEFSIDGLRLDVAEIMDKQFLAELAAVCRNLQPDIWLLGEVIDGNYNEWANAAMLDSTTNYDAYKGLYSSHNDGNYYEIAHTLDRQFGEHGIYKDVLLYNFADNHDTTRIFSILNDKAHLFPVYAVLFTMPGIPSVYYGSEWGIEGIKGIHDDTLLRPQVSVIPDLSLSPIFYYIKQLVYIRQQYYALRYGKYELLYVSHEQLIFERRTTSQLMIIAVNASAISAEVTFVPQKFDGLVLRDVTDNEYCICMERGALCVQIPGNGVRILSTLISE